MEKIQDGKLDMSKKKLEQEPKAVDHENLKNKAEKAGII